MEKKLNKVVLSLGSNIGERRENLSLAYEHVEKQIGKIVKSSSFYENPSQGFDSNNDFINSCIAIETTAGCREVLDKIQSGKFTKEWMDECKNGQKNFLKTREKLAEHPIEKVGAELRAMMPWITKKKLVDSDKN